MYLVQSSITGPYAAPGSYRGRLTVDGAATQERPFKILMDPRLQTVTAADLQEQFAFAMQIHRRLNDGTSAVAAIRRMRRDIDDRVRQAGDRAVVAEGDKLKATIDDIEEKLYQVRADNAGSAAQYGVRIVERLSHLLNHDVLSADARPTRAQHEVFGVTSKDLQVQLDRLEQVKKVGLPRFNELVVKTKPQP
jgi:hypothetical protein